MSHTLLRPIGIIHSPHREQAGTPVQPVFAAGIRGTVTVFDPYVDALADLGGFERIWLLFAFHRSGTWTSRVVPYRHHEERGLFATRAPARPNPIGLSVVRLLSIEGATLHVEDVDILDRSPLLDIKPYVPEFDSFPESRAGWLDEGLPGRTTADDRFAGDEGETKPGTDP